MHSMEKKSKAGTQFLLQIIVGVFLLHNTVLEFFKWVVA
jgi:hypothetical protein